MSRRGGLQAKTLAMYNRLDQLSQEWVSRIELAAALEDEFGRTFGYAARAVDRWALSRGDAVAKAEAGKSVFYCSRSGAALDVAVLCKQFWGTLPKAFRLNHDMAGIPEEDRLHGVLMAYGYLCLGRPECRDAFNRWAPRYKQFLIRKEL
jgi:hypothetical protein